MSRFWPPVLKNDPYIYIDSIWLPVILTANKTVIMHLLKVTRSVKPVELFLLDQWTYTLSASGFGCSELLYILSTHVNNMSMYLDECKCKDVQMFVFVQAYHHITQTSWKCLWFRWVVSNIMRVYVDGIDNYVFIYQVLDTNYHDDLVCDVDSRNKGEFSKHQLWLPLILALTKQKTIVMQILMLTGSDEPVLLGFLENRNLVHCQQHPMPVYGLLYFTKFACDWCFPSIFSM